MKMTRIHVVVLALAASLAAAVVLGDASSLPTDVERSTQGGDATTGSRAGERGIVAAFPTAEAGFAIRRPVVERP